MAGLILLLSFFLLYLNSNHKYSALLSSMSYSRKLSNPRMNPVPKSGLRNPHKYFPQCVLVYIRYQVCNPPMAVIAKNLMLIHLLWLMANLLLLLLLLTNMEARGRPIRRVSSSLPLSVLEAELRLPGLCSKCSYPLGHLTGTA